MNTTIKCGKCKGTHESVKRVRACYANDSGWTDPQTYPLPNTVEAEPTPELNPVLAKIQEQGKQVRMATEAQIRYAKDLCAARPMWANVMNYHADVLERMTFADISQVITEGKALPKEQGEKAKADKALAPQVPEGYYAVQAATDTELRFYRVQAGKAGGKWEGFLFVAMQASDEWYPQKGNRRLEILDAIAADTAAAAKRYAEEIGSCYICNRTLTDDESRAQGIGPVCRNKGLAL